MTASVNGLDLLSAVITEPRIGVWTAELEVDSDEALTGAVTIVIDEVAWKGTVIRGSAFAGRSSALAVGGAGKLASILPAKYYRNITASTVLADITSATGETLSDGTDKSVKQRQLPRWARSYASAGQAVRQIADEAGVPWRILRDGKLWLGAETWPKAVATFDQTHEVPRQGSITVGPERPTILPGTVLDDRHVSRVTTRLTGDSLRQELLFEDAEIDSHDRVQRDVAAVIESFVGNRLDYGRLYAAKVVSQAGDGTLEVIADDEKIKGTGITAVPIRHGIPGVTVKVPDGGKVLLFFENGDPKLPAAALWPDGSSCESIHITAPKITIDGDLEVTGEITAMSASPGTAVKVSTHLHPTAMGPSSKPTPGT